jgi:hypothetical protein
VGGDRALEAVVVDSDVGAGVVVNIDILFLACVVFGARRCVGQRIRTTSIS